MIQTKKCIVCGKFFEKKINRSRKSWATAKYCSNPCINVGRESVFKGSTTRWSEEAKKKLSLKNIGICSNTGSTHIKKGQHLSPETEFKLGQKSWLRGKKNPSFAGPNNPRWKGGVTPEHLKIRWSVEMKNFRDEILKRDEYTCKFCGRYRKVGDRVVLNVHHIKSFATHKEFRFDRSNVITLCRECHLGAHSKTMI